MFRRSRITVSALVAIAAAALLAACGGGSATSKGSVSVGLTDKPGVGFHEVVVHVTGLAFKPEGGAPEVVPDFEPRSINLLEHQNGHVAVLLEDVPMNAGRYQWLRLLMDATPNVDDSYVTLESAPNDRCELIIPSGAESGLKMNRPIEVPAGGSLALTIDFDVRKSISAQPSGAVDPCVAGYTLRPTLRLVDDSLVGAIAGDVDFRDDPTTQDECPSDPYVYVYEGTVDLTTVTADDEFVTSARVKFPPDNPRLGSYQAAFLPPDDYTVGLTCYDPEGADPLTFLLEESGVGATVETKLITTVDFVFPAPAG